MKTKFWYLLLSAFIFISCQKEYSVENNTGTTATFTFDGSPTSCLVAVAQGSYEVGVALDASNVVTIGVNVTKLGTYSITTNLINGIKFSGAGTFSALGSQNIDLAGTGTPVAQGPFDFKTAATGCTFTIDVTSAALPAVFVYAGAPGNCTSPVVNGVYASGTALGTTNTVDLTVTVTTAGAYSVVTNTANGVSFRGSGTLNTGTQTLRLTGQGTPTAAGPFTFTPTNNGCAFPITFTAPLPPAKFTFVGAPGNCTAPVISGSYKAGTALTAANTITLTVNVTVAGTYSITTNAVNGVTFSGTGNLAVGANKIITLTSINTPAAAATSTYTPKDNNNAANAGCTFDVVYTPGTTGGVTGTYTAKVGATTYNFATNNLDAGYVIPNTIFGIYGESSTTSINPSFEIFFNNDPNAVVAATYKNLSVGNTTQICEITYTDAAGTAYETSLLNANSFSAVITAITATSITGTFSGTLYDNLGVGPGTVVVTAGTFNIQF
jgi:hypothetical protein